MKLNLVLIGIVILIIFLASTNIIGFSDNVSAGMANGFVYGIAVAAVLNIIALKLKK